MSPAQRYALRLAIEEVYTAEVDLARRRRDLALVRVGIHPSLPLIEALIGWGEAIRGSQTPRKEGGSLS